MGETRFRRAVGALRCSAQPEPWLLGRSLVGARNGLGDQLLPGLTRVNIAEVLVLRIDVQQSCVAGFAANERIGHHCQERVEHVSYHGAKSLRRCC